MDLFLVSSCAIGGASALLLVCQSGILQIDNQGSSSDQDSCIGKRVIVLQLIYFDTKSLATFQLCSSRRAPVIVSLETWRRMKTRGLPQATRSGVLDSDK